MKRRIAVWEGISHLFEISNKRYYEMFLLLIVIFLNSFIEIIGLSLIQPVIALATGQNIAIKSDIPFANFLFNLINISEYNFYTLCISLIFTLISGTICSIYLISCGSSLASNLRNDWTKKLFSKALYAPYYAIAKEGTGVIIETISTETREASRVVVSLVKLFQSGILSIFLIIGLFISNFYPTIIFISISLIVLFCLKLLGFLKSIKRGKKMVEYNQSISSIITESILNIRQIKLLDAYKKYLSKLEEKLEEFKKVKVNFDISNQLPGILIKYLVIIVGVASLMYVYSINRNSLLSSLPKLSLLVVLAARLSNVFSILSSQTMKFNMGLALIDSIYYKIKRKDLFENLIQGSEIKKIDKIVFEDVSFSWPNNNTDVIKKLNLEFEKGVTILTGKSGSGKSTVAAIILGLLQPHTGVVRFNNEKFNSYNLKSIRSSISYVTQEYELFNGSILENLRLGNPKTSYLDVIKAAKKAAAHEFIELMPKGYETIIYDMGKTLSGGQKQRLALARALIKSHSVYIFDEVTNSLDRDTEELVQKTIDELGKENIVIQISHLESSTKNVDRIYQFTKNGVKIIRN